MIDRARNAVRRVVSLFLCLFQLYMAFLYVFPSLVARVGNPSPTVRIVQFIQSLGPYYTVGFAFSGGILLITLLVPKLRKWIFFGHLVCFGVFFSYGFALFLGALSDHPHGPIVTPSLAMIPIVGHAVLALVYGGERP
jgi:hypothetical protein